MSERARIIDFRLDDSFGRGRRPEVEQERAVAIADRARSARLAMFDSAAMAGADSPRLRDLHYRFRQS